jgi:hypothetical protein
MLQRNLAFYHLPLNFKVFFGEGQYWGLNSGPCTCWAVPLSLEPCLQLFFVLVIFQIRLCAFCLGAGFRMLLLCNWDDSYTQCDWDGVSLTFDQGQPKQILLISAYWLTGIIKMHHHAQLHQLNKMCKSLFLSLRNLQFYHGDKI